MAEPHLDPSALTALPRPAEVPAFSDRPRHPQAIRAARTIAEALFSTGSVAAPAERVQWLMTELDLVLIQAGWRPGGFYRLGLFAVCWIAPLMIARPGPLWRLGIADRVRALRKLESSFAASLILGVKAILCLIYFEHPDAVRETGNDSSCHGGVP